MAITRNAVADDAGGKSGASDTFTHTTVAGDTFLIVDVTWFLNANAAAAAPSGVTFDGVAMTSVGVAQSDASNSIGCQQFYLVNPTIGAKSVVVTFGAATTSCACGSASFSGIDTSGPVRTPGRSTGVGGTTPTVTVTTVAGDEVVDVACEFSTLNVPGGSQSTIFHRAGAGGSNDGGGSNKTAAGVSTTMTWSVSAAGAWVNYAVPLVPLPTVVPMTRRNRQGQAVTRAAVR